MNIVLYFIILGAFSVIMTLFYVLQEEPEKAKRFFTMRTFRLLLKSLGVFRFRSRPDYFKEEEGHVIISHSFRMWHPITIIFIIIVFPFSVLWEGIPESISGVQNMWAWYDWYE